MAAAAAAVLPGELQAAAAKHVRQDPLISAV